MARTADSAAPSRMIPRALVVLRRRGADVDALIRAAGLPPDAERREEVAIAPASFEALMAGAAAMLDDPLVALRLPDALEFPAYHVGELAARASPTLREAFERVGRYASLFYAYLSYAYEERDGELVVIHRQRHRARGGRYGNEYALASTLHHARRITGVALAPRRVWFAHREGDLPALRAFFGTDDVALGRSDSGLAFPADAADLRSVAHDPRLLATAEQLAEQALRDAPPEADLIAAVTARLRAGPTSSVGDVARSLRMSPRTLQRRLAGRDTSFTSLVDRVRHDLACELLRDPSLPTAEVAYRLGFSDPASFGRAFRRWTGQSPSAWRARG